jgi:hypothetical protein
MWQRASLFGSAMSGQALTNKATDQQGNRPTRLQTNKATDQQGYNGRMTEDPCRARTP